MSSARGLVIAAPRSSSGKTIVTLGLLRALSRRGLRVAGAKCGPDYIDPAFHTAATGRSSLNFDTWAMPRELLSGLARFVTDNAEITLCEGLMGLFDGVPAETGRSGSTADIAAALGWPVLLVLDVSGQAQSAAAIVQGCAIYDRRIRIAGVVINKAGSARHTRLVREAIEALGIPVLGTLPRNDHVKLPERHLGLVQASETKGLADLLDSMAELVEEHLDIDAICAAAAPLAVGPTYTGPALAPPGQRIALARDEAFSFVYPHLLQGWRAAGAEIVAFSPLADEPPPDDCDMCWLPGGYPELHAGRLAAAHRFLSGLNTFAQTRSVYGECGGYMVLGKVLVDASGAAHHMAGLLNVETSFAQRKMSLGYREITLFADGPLGRTGARLRGHEFHYATIKGEGSEAPFALVRDAYGSPPMPAGAQSRLVSGSFFHAIARVAD